MRSLEIAHFGGVIEVADLDALAQVLSERFGHDANEFLIADTQSEYPMLTILVRGDISAVYYFPRVGHPGFASTGDRRPGELETFYSGSPREVLQIASDAVIPFEVARAAAREFMESPALPTAISWFEL
jgi:hypothetical protein